MHGADCIRLRFRMSFGERDKRRNKEFSGLPGGNSEREPPDPIPNSEVKTFCADGSVAAGHARVGHCQASHAKAPMLERASGPFLLAYMLPALASSRSQLLHSPRVCHNRGDQNRSEAHLSVERWPAKRKCGPRQQHRSRQRLHNAAPPTVHQLRPLAVRQCTLASVPLADIEVLSRMAAPPQVVPVPRLKLRGEAPMPFAKKRLKYAGSSKPR